MGKSATGKDTIFKRLTESKNVNLKTIVSYTTRPIRDGEMEGQEYFFVDDERLKPVYEKISELGLITVFHSGKDLAYKPPYKCSPERLLKALKWLSAPVIAAHWGASGLSRDVIKYLCGTDVYLDTAFGYGYINKDEANRIIEKHGTDKILFGTDSPWSLPERELDLINTLDLSENDKNKIFYENGKNLLKIK